MWCGVMWCKIRWGKTVWEEGRQNVRRVNRGQNEENRQNERKKWGAQTECEETRQHERRADRVRGEKERRADRVRGEKERRADRVRGEQTEWEERKRGEQTEWEERKREWEESRQKEHTWENVRRPDRMRGMRGEDSRQNERRPDVVPYFSHQTFSGGSSVMGLVSLVLWWMVWNDQRASLLILAVLWLDMVWNDQRASIQTAVKVGWQIWDGWWVAVAVMHPRLISTWDQGYKQVSNSGAGCFTKSLMWFKQMCKDSAFCKLKRWLTFCKIWKCHLCHSTGENVIIAIVFVKSQC